MASPEDASRRRLVIPTLEVDVPNLARSVMGEFHVARPGLDPLPLVSVHSRFGRVVKLEAALPVAEVRPLVYDTPTLDSLAALVCADAGVAIEDLQGDSRKRPVVEARQLVMALAVDLSGQSTPQIGRFLKRDHTTVLNGHTKVSEREAADPAFKDMAEELRRKATTLTSRQTEAGHVVLLSEHGLERVVPERLEANTTAAIGLKKGDEVLIRPSEPITPEDTYELWAEFGQAAADGLSVALRA